MLGSLHEADDAVQEALPRAWRALDTYRDQAPLRHWLYRITTTSSLRTGSRICCESSRRRSSPCWSAGPAKLAGTGVTVNAYRPGGVDTAVQAWIRSQGPERIGGLHERFNKTYAEGSLITPEYSAAALLAHLAGDGTGEIWDVSTAPVRA